MDILLFLVMLLAGTGVFLVGVHLLTENIEHLATGKIKSLFNKTANNRLLNVGIGGLTTAIIQSSGVTTVLIVGFVNVGIMSLYQATAMIMGANIGTTITAQIAALSAFDFTTYIQILAFAGVLATMICKKDKTKRIGFICAGLGLVFIGLDLMSASMKDYKDLIQVVFENVTNPFLLFFIGIFLTALVQSSSATTSIIIAMSIAGLTIGTGGNEVLFIILGTNIGSCVTALMSSFGAGTNAKRASLIHLLFNSFGSILFIVLLLLYPNFMKDTFMRWFPAASTQIAMFHTFFNVTCTLIFLPFTGLFVKLSQLLIKDKKVEAEQTFLDERILSSASLAVSHLEKESMLLSDIAMDAFLTSYKSFKEKDNELAEKASQKVDKAGEKSKNIIAYLIKASANADQNVEKQLSDIHNNIGDIMRIAEIADNFTKYTARSVKHGLDFSSTVKDNLDLMVGKLEEMYELTKKVILEKDYSLIPQIDRIEATVDGYRKSFIDDHIDRLNRGVCKPESSSVFINLVSNLERLGDHITYIAHASAE